MTVEKRITECCEQVWNAHCHSPTFLTKHVPLYVLTFLFKEYLIEKFDSFEGKVTNFRPKKKKEKFSSNSPSEKNRRIDERENRSGTRRRDGTRISVSVFSLFLFSIKREL